MEDPRLFELSQKASLPTPQTILTEYMNRLDFKIQIKSLFSPFFFFKVLCFQNYEIEVGNLIPSFVYE